MLFDQPKLNQDQHIVGSSVYDLNKDYIGVVVKVSRGDDNQLSLLVQGDSNPAGPDLMAVNGESIQKIDLQRSKVYVDLNRHAPVSVEVESLPLWQEQVAVNRNRRKVGEISVRKTTDIYTLEVPVRSEKLVVENVDTGETLAEVGLSNTRVTQRDESDLSAELKYSEGTLVRGHLTELTDAISFLEAVSQFPKNGFCKGKITMTLARQQGTETIALTFDWATTALQTLSCLSGMITTRYKGIDLELWVSDRERATTYQNWLSRYLRPGNKPRPLKHQVRR